MSRNDEPRVSLSALSWLPCCLGRTAAGATVRSSHRKRRPEAASSATLPPVAALPPASGLRSPSGTGVPAGSAFPSWMHRCNRSGPAGSVSFSDRSHRLIRALVPRRETSLCLREVDHSFLADPGAGAPAPLMPVRSPVGSPLPAHRKVRPSRTDGKAGGPKYFAAHRFFSRPRDLGPVRAVASAHPPLIGDGPTGFRLT